MNDDLDRARTRPPAGSPGGSPRAGGLKPRGGGTGSKDGGPRVRTGGPKAVDYHYRSPTRPKGSPNSGGRNSGGNRNERGGVAAAPPVVRSTPRRSNPVERRLRPTLHPRGGGGSSGSNYGSYSIAGSTRYMYGGYHWGGHFAALSWGTPYGGCWGYYSYPYYWGNWCASFYYRCRSSFVFYWNSRYPSFYSCWWWPRRCYYPGSYFGFSYFDYYSRDYVDWAAYPSAGTTVVEAEKPEPETDEERLRRLAQQHLELGDYYFKAGRFEEAAESYLRALTYAPEDGSIHFVIADALFAQGDYHYAAFMITHGLELDPSLAAAEADKREFYGDASLFDRELEVLRRYLVEKPFDAAAHLVLGYNLKFSGDPAGAVKAFERVLEIDPGNEPAKLFLEALAAGKKPDAPEEAPKKEAGT